MLGKFTLQQLKDGCRMGMLDSWGTTKFFPDYKETFEKQKDELDYVVITPSNYEKIDAKFLHIKRPEIKTMNKYYIPYSTRIISLCGEDIFAIQQLDYDYSTTKVVGNEDQISIIKGFLSEKNIFKELSDNEMWEKHYRDLEAYRDIPTLSNYKGSNLVKGTLTPTPEKLDIMGQHVTQIDDYDNYKYLIFGVSHQKYVEIHNDFLSFKRNEDKGIYWDNKLERWENDVFHNSRRICQIISTKPKFVDDIREYTFKDGQKLSDEDIMTDLCNKHGISWKGGWAVWKFMNIDDLEIYVTNEEYLKENDIVSNLDR